MTRPKRASLPTTKPAAKSPPNGTDLKSHISTLKSTMSQQFKALESQEATKSFFFAFHNSEQKAWLKQLLPQIPIGRFCFLCAHTWLFQGSSGLSQLVLPFVAAYKEAALGFYKATRTKITNSSHYVSYRLSPKVELAVTVFKYCGLTNFRLVLNELANIIEKYYGCTLETLAEVPLAPTTLEAVGKTTLDKASLDKTTLDQTSLDKTSSDKTTQDHLVSAAQVVQDATSASKTSAAKATATSQTQLVPEQVKRKPGRPKKQAPPVVAEATAATSTPESTTASQAQATVEPPTVEPPTVEPPTPEPPTPDPLTPELTPADSPAEPVTPEPSAKELQVATPSKAQATLAPNLAVADLPRETSPHLTSEQVVPAHLLTKLKPAANQPGSLGQVLLARDCEELIAVLNSHGPFTLKIQKEISIKAQAVTLTKAQYQVEICNLELKPSPEQALEQLGENLSSANADSAGLVPMTVEAPAGTPQQLKQAVTPASVPLTAQKPQAQARSENPPLEKVLSSDAEPEDVFAIAVAQTNAASQAETTQWVSEIFKRKRAGTKPVSNDDEPYTLPKSFPRRVPDAGFGVEPKLVNEEVVFAVVDKVAKAPASEKAAQKQAISTPVTSTAKTSQELTQEPTQAEFQEAAEPAPWVPDFKAAELHIHPDAQAAMDARNGSATASTAAISSNSDSTNGANTTSATKTTKRRKYGVRTDFAKTSAKASKQTPPEQRTQNQMLKEQQQIVQHLSSAYKPITISDSELDALFSPWDDSEEDSEIGRMHEQPMTTTTPASSAQITSTPENSFVRFTKAQAIQRRSTHKFKPEVFLTSGQPVTSKQARDSEKPIASRQPASQQPLSLKNVEDFKAAENLEYGEGVMSFAEERARKV